MALFDTKGLSSAELSKIYDREQDNEAKRLGRALRVSPKLKSQLTEPVRIELPAGGSVSIGRSCVVIEYGGMYLTRNKLNEKSINLLLMRLQMKTRNWPDGTLRGLKILQHYLDVETFEEYWISPSQGTRWRDGMCQARGFSPSEQVRGNEGIHATWVDTPKELSDYQGSLVEVAGWGQAVVGDLGWRAEFCKVVRKLI